MKLSDKIRLGLGTDTSGESFKIHQAKYIEKDHYQGFKKHRFEADLVFMPKEESNNEEFRYLLTIVNIATKAVDAEPLPSKESAEMKYAMDQILKRNYITAPKEIMTDHGSEFNNKKFIQYLEKKNIRIIVGNAEKKQTTMIEHYNSLITKYIYENMAVRTHQEGNRQKDWIKLVPTVIKIINEHNKGRFTFSFKKAFQQTIPNMNTPLKIGDKVLKVVDKPTDFVTGKKYFGAFRHGDVRYNPKKVHEIKSIGIMHGRPVRYRISGIEDRTFVQGELLKT